MEMNKTVHVHTISLLSFPKRGKRIVSVCRPTLAFEPLSQNITQHISNTNMAEGRKCQTGQHNFQQQYGPETEHDSRSWRNMHFLLG
jgi:hypothetical protein